MPQFTKIFQDILYICTMKESTTSFYLYFCVFDTFRPTWKFIRLTLQFHQFASRDKFLYLYPSLHHEKLREHM